MNRFNTARVLAGTSALGFFLAAGLHTSGYGEVVLHAQQGVGCSPLEVAALWMAFAAALFVFGIMVALVALRRVTGGRWVLALAGCFPLITVLLQLRLVGFIPPVVTLSAVAAVTFAAALVWPAVSQGVDVGAA
jgi:hypothetical protein